MIEAFFWLLLRRKQVRILHVHESHWIAGFGAWVGHRLDIPTVVKEASFPVLMPVGRVPFRRLWESWRLRAWYIAQTEHAKDALIGAGVKSGLIAVIPNGVKMPLRSVDVTANRDVLYVGNLHQGTEWKAFDVLFAAWRIVAEACPASCLMIAGAGDLTYWLDYVTRIGIFKSVEFRGYVSNLAPLYDRSAVFVLPSRREGMSNALLEAQSWGLPAIVSDIPSNRVVVRDRENGLVVPEGNAHAFAGAVIELIQNHKERARLGLEARLNVENDFSLSSVSHRLIDLYKQVYGTNLHGNAMV